MKVYVIIVEYCTDEQEGSQEKFDSVHPDMISAERRVKEIAEGVNISNDLKIIRDVYTKYRGRDPYTYFCPEIRPCELAIPK